ncbi:MAG: pyrimidine utilization protein A [Proteobacteria bacterium]|nr:pyrimidine utilization protein A [Pseudomonadota bacterium]
MQVGVFIPIANNGWLISTTSPQFKPSFDLNKAVVERAERYGMDFALSMIKLRGFGGASQFWDYNLESFTLMAGLAAVTSRIQLFATCSVLTLPPPLAARMAVTIDSISHGRFGLNMITGWQEKEYSQMGIWPGEAHHLRRYDYCAEYVTIMRELWDTGRSDFRGDFFQMDDCRCLPMPTARIPIICAGQSDKGTEFAARFADYNFCSSFGVNTPGAVAPSAARLVEANRLTGRDCGALVVMMVIAEATQAEAEAKWEHYRNGIDMEAMGWRQAQAEKDPTTDKYAAAGRFTEKLRNRMPTMHGALVGSYEQVAALLDEYATIPGVRGVMLTFDEFVSGMDKFGQFIQPLMRSRAHMAAAA